MFRYITPIILIGVAITGAFLYTNPLIKDITSIKNDMVSYNEALNNARKNCTTIRYGVKGYKL